MAPSEARPVRSAVRSFNTFGSAASALDLSPEDLDAAARAAARREAVDILLHQLEVERQLRAQSTVEDMVSTAVIGGAAAGIGYAVIQRFGKKRKPRVRR